MSVALGTAPMIRVSLYLGTRRIDVALDEGHTVADLLTAAQIPAVRGLLVLDSAGRVLDPDAAVAAQVEDGTGVHVVAPAPRPRQGRGGPAPADDELRRPAPVTGLLAVAATGLVAAAAGVLLLGSPDGLLVSITGAVAGVAALATAALVRSTAASVAAPVLALTAPVLGIAPQSGPDRRLALVAGLIAAAAVAGLGFLRARTAREGDDLATVLLTGWGATAVSYTVALLTSQPAVMAAGLLVGLVPLGLRVLPVAALRVPDTQLIDVAYVSRSAPSVRSPQPRPLGRVNERLVTRTVESAERRADAGVVVVCLTAVLLVPAVLTAAIDRGTLTGWAGFALALLLITVLALQPRTARRSIARWAPRIAGGLVLVESVVVLGPWLGVAAAPAAVFALVTAMTISAFGVLLSRGWRSVFASRVGDALESLAMALTLPAALVAVDLIETLRRVMS